MKRVQGQFLLSEIWPLADKIAEYLRQHDQIQQAEVAGSIRRRSIIVEAIEIVAAAGQPERVAEIASAMPGIEKVLDRSNNGVKAVLNTGMKLNLQVVRPEQFVLALHAATGSNSYCSQLKGYAANHGVQIPEAPNNERAIYSALGLDYIEPELREGLGEIDKAARKELPVLVTEKDIKGAFHVHTSYSDGRATIAEMAAVAQKRGWHYLGISDHSRTAHYAGGLKLKAVTAQRKEIDKFNAENDGLRLFAGIESDILPDGSLDYPDDILAQFDFVIASVHSAFRIGQEKMTKRFIKAAENKYVTMLGHPTGRMLLTRPEYAVDIPAIIKAAANTGTLIEINSSPRRLDLDWQWCRVAKDKGVMLAINPDAHDPGELDYVRYGTATARKGGLSPENILNTRSAEEAVKIIAQKRGK